MQWLFTGWVVTVSHWLNPCQSRRANISSSVGICYHYRPWELPLLAFQFYLNWSFITFYKNNNTKRSEDKEKQYHRHCWSECKLAQPLWNTLGRFLQNPTHTITKPSICTLGYYLWETKTYLHTNTAQEGDKLKVAEQKDMYSSFLQFSCSVMSNSLWPNGLQHARLPCPSPTPGACSNSCPLSRWCHPTISSSVIPFSSCLQSFQHQGLFQWVSSLHQVAKVLELQLQYQSFQWIFRTDFL